VSAPGYARPAAPRRPTAAARTGASPYDAAESPLSRTRRALRKARELAEIDADAHCDLDVTNPD
jgi:endonuclease-3